MSTMLKRHWRIPAYAGGVMAASLLTVLFFTHSPVQGATEQEALDAAKGLGNAFARIAAQASPGVVSIQVEKEMAAESVTPFGEGPMMSPEDFFEYFFRQHGRRGVPRQAPGRERGEEPKGRSVPYGQGTGFVISPDGYIVTNHHVVGEADKISVKTSDGRTLDAKRIGSDPETEIAIIKVESDNLTPLPLGNSDQIKVGEWVLAIGNPFGLENTVTSGIVSARGRGNVGIVDYADFIQTDAAINPGNSGGPLLNLDGQVVGMNTAIFSRSGGYMGIGFAIPINMVKYVRDQIVQHGSISRGFLGVGIQNLTPDVAEWFGLKDKQGVLVTEVKEGSAADKAGIKRDDVVIEFDGQPVTEVGSFRSRVASTEPGKTINLVLMRNGERIETTVEVGKLDETAMTVNSATGEVKNLGVAVQNLSDELADRFGYKGDTGVVVTEVEPGSSAERAGIQSGSLIKEVNRQPIKNTQDFEKALKESSGKKTILLLVRDGEMSRYVALQTE